MKMNAFLPFGCALLLSIGLSAAEKKDPPSRASAYGAMLRGDTLNWDQLEVVAADAGVSKEHLAQLALKDRLTQLIRRWNLPLEVAGFTNGMAADEEFRLYKGSKPGWGAMLLNAGFWSKAAGTYDSDAFLSYLLFRAQAYYIYKSRYDGEHAAWIVDEESPSLQVLRSALNGSAGQWAVDDSQPTGRDLEYRHSLEPNGNDQVILRKLIESALRIIAQKAADDWALQQYQEKLGAPPALVTAHIQKRERALEWDFNRAHSAMLRSERLAFLRLLKDPRRIRRRIDSQPTEPVFDPPASPPPETAR